MARRAGPELSSVERAADASTTITDRLGQLPNRDGADRGRVSGRQPLEPLDDVVGHVAQLEGSHAVGGMAVCRRGARAGANTR
jgi:hypothetical protein